MNRSKSIYKLAQNLETLFLSYGVKENKLLKLQLKSFLANEFIFPNIETMEELINDLINSYDPFNEYMERLEWFKTKSLQINNKFN